MSQSSTIPPTRRRYGLASWMGYPSGPGVMFTTGLDPMSHAITQRVLRTGLLAPEVKLTSAGASAVKATDVLTFNSQPTNGDTIASLGYTSGFPRSIKFQSTLTVPTDALQDNVLIGASLAATIANVVALISGTAGYGTTYYDTVYYSSGSPMPTWQRIYTPGWVEIAASTSTTITFRAAVAGTIGNAFVATETFTDAASTFATALFTGGVNATAGLPQAGSYYHGYSYLRSEDGAESGMSPISTRLTIGADGNISLSVLADPAQVDFIDYKVWWRTFANGRSDALNEGYRIATADTTDTDDLGNLEADVPSLYAHQQYDATIHRSFKEGMIPRLRYMVPYKGMWIAAGIYRAAEYAIGTCDVTITDNEVNLDSPAMPTKAMEGRTFARGSGADAATTYTIIWVDEANRKIYLDRGYEGATASNVTYTITDKRDAFRLYRCEPLKPNQTTGTMVFDGVSSPDPAGITGLAFAFESVLAFTKTGLFRLTGTGTSALTTRITNEFEGAGCLSHHSIVYTGGAVYWMGPDGFYKWVAGQAKPTRISNPEGRVEGIAATFRRINLLHASGVFGHYDAKRNTIRWLVPLDGETANRYALAYNVATGKWSGPLQYPDLTCIVTVPGQNGVPRNLAGDIYGDVWEIDTSNADGYFGAEGKATLTAATTILLTASGASWSTSGDALKGLPAILARVATGSFEHFVIGSNTSTTLTPTRPFSTAPSVGDVVMVGGIHMHAESGRTHFGKPGIKKQVGYVKTFVVPAVDGQVWQSSAAEQDDLTLDASLDPTLADGEELAWSNKNGREWKLAYDCIEPGMDPVIVGIGVQVNVPDRVRS